MSLTTEETLEIGLNRLIYAAEQISRHFTKGGEMFATLNFEYPFNESFDDVLYALLQWRDSACNKQTNWDSGDLAGAIMQLSNALQ